MTAEVFTQGNHRKFIPVLARGTWNESAPGWLSGKYYLDLSHTTKYEAGYKNLRDTILRTREQAPPLPIGFAQGRQSPAERAIDFYEYALGQFSTVVAEEQLDTKELGFLDIVLVLDGTTERKWHNEIKPAQRLAHARIINVARCIQAN
jgi:hypothetical protein